MNIISFTDEEKKEYNDVIDYFSHHWDAICAEKRITLTYIKSNAVLLSVGDIFWMFSKLFNNGIFSAKVDVITPNSKCKTYNNFGEIENTIYGYDLDDCTMISYYTKNTN